MALRAEVARPAKVAAADWFFRPVLSSPLLIKAEQRPPGPQLAGLSAVAERLLDGSRGRHAPGPLALRLPKHHRFRPDGNRVWS
jgi:hypothetical protein